MSVSSSSPDPLVRLYLAQRHEGTFGGSELLQAARSVARIAANRHLRLMACDRSGERIVGTASALTSCGLVDTSSRLDGVAVLLVAGLLAGPVGLAQQAKTARSLGAREVHAVFLGGWEHPIEGCDSTTLLGIELLAESA